MAKPELGTKRADPEDGRKFYDLGKDPIVSPYTGKSYPKSFFDPPASEPSRRAPASSRLVHREKQPDTDDDETGDDEDDIASLEDGSGSGTPKRRSGSAKDDQDEDREFDNDKVLARDDDDDEDMSDIVGRRHEDD